MKQYIYSIILLIVSVLSIHAQTQKLTMKQCVDLALQNNPQLQAANKQVERVKTLQGTAWDVDKTQLSLSQDPTSGGSPDNSLALSQSIDFPTLYVARHKQLKAETQAEQNRANIVRRDISVKVQSVYCQLVYENQRLLILAAQDSILQHYCRLATQRYHAGEVRKLEVLTAERLQKENLMELTTARAEAEGVRLQMAQLTGVPTVDAAESKLVPLPLVQTAYNYQQSANGLYASSRLNAASRAVSVARNGYAPSLSLSLRHQLVITGWDPYHVNRSKFDGGNFMGFEVGVGVPLFFGATKAKVKAAKKSRDVAELEMQSEQQQMEKDYMSALCKCNAAQQRMEYYLEEGNDKAGELMRLGTLEYENGEISYIEYVNALQESMDIRMKSAQAVNDFNQSVVALKTFTE